MLLIIILFIFILWRNYREWLRKDKSPPWIILSLMMSSWTGFIWYLCHYNYPHSRIIHLITYDISNRYTVDWRIWEVRVTQRLEDTDIESPVIPALLSSSHSMFLYFWCILLMLLPKDKMMISDGNREIVETIHYIILKTLTISHLHALLTNGL